MSVSYKTVSIQGIMLLYVEEMQYDCPLLYYVQRTTLKTYSQLTSVSYYVLLWLFHLICVRWLQLLPPRIKYIECN